MSIDPAAMALGLSGGDFFGLGGDDAETPVYTVGTGSPLADPFINYATQYALALMGQTPDIMTQQQASPFAMAFSRYLDQVATSDDDRRQILKDFNNIMRAAQAAGGITPEIIEKYKHGDTIRMAAAMGMTLTDLATAQYNWQADFQERFGRAQDLAGFGEQGRYAATRQLFELIRDMPSVTPHAIEALKGEQYDRLVREINRQAGEQSQMTLEQANAANYNPGRVLGDIEESRFNAIQNADLSALEYAVNMLGAQTNLGQTQAGVLENYINYPMQIAAQMANIRQAGGNVPAQSYVQPSTWQNAIQSMTQVQNANTASVQAAAELVGKIGMAGCWCSAVYYGWFTQDWWDCRSWILEGWNTWIGRLFRRAYLRFGARAAKWLQRSRLLRAALRPLFEWIREEGAEYRWQTAVRR